VLLTPPLFNPNFGGVPVAPDRMGLKLFGREIIFKEFQCIWARYLNVTDRQTDRHTDESNLITVLCASIAR